MVIRKRIAETSHYNSLNNLQQKFILGKTNLELIRHGFVVSQNRGFDYWVSSHVPRLSIKLIVEELLN